MHGSKEMTRLSKRQINQEKFIHYINNLWACFVLLNSKEDVRMLFRDLFTHTEYKMLAKRLEIARRLLNEENYRDIQEELAVTSHTISRVSQILEEKGEGYRKADKELQGLEKKYFRKQRERTKNLENPFRLKARRKTVGGAMLKAGLKVLDKAIIKRSSKKSAAKKLKI